MSIKKQPQPTRSQLIGYLLLGLGGLILATNWLMPRSDREMPAKIPLVNYSIFIQQVEQGQVEEVVIAPNQLFYKLKTEEPQETIVQSTIPIPDPDFLKRLETHNVSFGAIPLPQQRQSWWPVLLNWVIPPLILVAALRFMMKRDDENPRGSLAFSKSKAKVYVEGEATKITFANVAGVEEAKTELAEIVEFLKHPQKFTEIGARIPKGVLLVGPPGTGKTLMAKAVAGEAGVTFFSISASEFVELFVGTGAARVRDLFEQAKNNAPCIVFIDELDAIGKSRSSGAPSGSNDEREQTLNQLLTEMDGFSASESTVIVLAATNRPETLDPALLRPGRFDRQVLVDRPDVSGRQAILEIYAQKVKLDQAVDLHAIAVITPGFAGAELANLINEAALLAARKQREVVTQEDLKEAIERVVAGLEKRSRVLNPEDKKVVAYHEVGHAIVGAVVPGSGEVAKISIVPRGMNALGYMLRLPTEDRFLSNNLELRGQITTLLGGRAAEEIMFGTVTTGAADDLQRATQKAELMVTTYGMSQVLGPLVYDQSQSGNFLGGGIHRRRDVSEKTAELIDQEIKEIVASCYQEALDILHQNRSLLEKIATEVLQTEVLEGEELKSLLAEVEESRG